MFKEFYAYLIEKKPSWILIPILFISVFLLGHLSGLKTELSVYDINDPHFKSSIDINKMRSQFQDHNSIQALFYSKHPFTQKEFCFIEKSMIDISRKNNEIESLTTPSDYRFPLWNKERLLYPSLINYNCDSNEQLDLSKFSQSPFAYNVPGNSTSLVYDIEFKESKNNKYGKFDPTPIGEIYKSLNQTIMGSNLKFHIGGQSAILWHLKEMLKKDFGVNLSIVIFIIVFFRLFYGTFSSGIILIITLIFTCAVTFGAMSTFHIPLDLLTNSLFMLLLVSTVEDYIFLTSDLYDENKSPIESFKKLLLPGFMTSVTTFVGFGSLIISDLAIIKRFAIVGSMASILEWFVIFFVLPAILRVLGLKNYKWCKREKSYFQNFTLKLTKFTPSLTLTRVLITVGILSALSFKLINFNDHPEKKFEKTHPHQQYSDYLYKNFNSQGMIYLYFPISNQLKEEEIIAKIKTDPNILRTQTPWNILNYYAKDLPPKISDLVRSEMQTTSLYTKFFNKKSSRSVLYLKQIEQVKLNKTITNIKYICQNFCEPIGELVTYNEFSHEVTKTLFEGFLLSLFVVAVIIFSTCTVLKIKEKWKILISVIWCPFVLIGVLAALQIPINLVTSIVGSIFIGLTGDNAVQYIFSAAQENNNLKVGMDKRSIPSLQLAITCILSCFFFTKFTLLPLREVGIILMIGFILITIGDFYILKGLIYRDK